MKVFEVLEQIKDRAKIEVFGICDAINQHSNWGDVKVVWRDLRVLCFAAWPESTGNPDYPISCEGYPTPSGAFNLIAAKDFWNPEHPYGAARLRLLDHCIEWFKARGL